MDTRTRILEAARALVEEVGAEASMNSIARSADLSRRAVYDHFESRAQLLVSLVTYVDETGNLEERARRVTEADSARASLEAFVALNAEYNPEIHLIARALERARDTDDAAAAAWDDRMESRRRLCGWISRRLAEDGELANGVSIETATDLLWSLTNIPLWRDLVVERGWSDRRYRQWIGLLLDSILDSD